MQAVGYIRISRVGGRAGESFISPDVQRERIAAYAVAHGHTIVDYVTDKDQSGGTMTRPGFDRARRMIESGKADGLIVAKLDRFSRTLKGALDTIDELRAAGAELVSVAEQFDTTTPMGRAMLSITLVFAEMTRDQITADWATSREKAVDRGAYISKHVPLGYVRGADGRLVVDPAAAERVRAGFAARAKGVGLSECARIMGLVSAKTGRAVPQTAMYVLRNRAYLGESRHGRPIEEGGAGEYVNLAAHEPIVDRDVFEQAQVARPTATARNGEGRLLSGLIRCATCRSAMSGGSSSKAYKCSNPRCDKHAGIAAEAIESYVKTTYGMFVEAPALGAAAERDALLEELADAEARAVAYMSKADPTDAGFEAGRDANNARVAEARRAVAAIAAPELVELHDDDDPINVQRHKLSNAIAAVFVAPAEKGEEGKPKRRGEVGQRARIVRVGTPVDLPKRGRKGGGAAEPFVIEPY
jgi:DNA invertase Pin-like site-specific DNA recombinase